MTKSIIAFLFALLCWLPAECHIAEIDKENFLIVNNLPFIITSIEDHETIDFEGNIRNKYFKSTKQLFANTISVTFRWNFFEKQYGIYDTTILRNIKFCADNYHIKVVILWFGSNVSGHENCVPNYILSDHKKYIPYTRKDNTMASKIQDQGGGHIYCYSFDDRHKNEVLAREKKALQVLMQWITENDLEETFILLQLGNELFVHPALWKPWPPINFPPITLTPSKNYYEWDNEFSISASNLRISITLPGKKQFRMKFIISDTTGKILWNREKDVSERDTVHIGGDYVRRTCKFAIKLLEPYDDTVTINDISITPIAERCYCRRCKDIYKSKGQPGDQIYQQEMFSNYLGELAKAIAEINPDFPLYLNLLVSGDAKMLLGNPFYQPQRYLDEIPEIDFIAADIYLESATSFLDSLRRGRNIIFVPEAGQLNNIDEPNNLNAFSLIFDIIGTYNGIGIQIYDLKDSQFSLLSPDWQWLQNAYLVRNSFSVISLLPNDILTHCNEDCQIRGFRNVQEKTININDISIKITPITDTKYARGLVIKMDKQLILCGIGFTASISKEDIDNAHLERGIWKENEYLSLGELKKGSYLKKSHFMRINMDQDDYSPPDEYNILNKQYCVIVFLP